jgi:hypothetical protein
MLGLDEMLLDKMSLDKMSLDKMSLDKTLLDEQTWNQFNNLYALIRLSWTVYLNSGQFSL